MEVAFPAGPSGVQGVGSCESLHNVPRARVRDTLLTPKENVRQDLRIPVLPGHARLGVPVRRRGDDVGCDTQRCGCGGYAYAGEGVGGCCDEG
jgi:hypothetical protein